MADPRVIVTSLAVLATYIGPASYITTAEAYEARVGATTYLREGPGFRYRSVDEAPGGARVEVVSCAAGWCRVWLGDAPGFVAKGALVVGALPSPPSGPTRCYVAPEAGYHGAREIEICHPAGSP